jgi:hypothetical protein
MSSTTCFWRSSGMSRMPKARLAVLRFWVTTPCEKYAGTASRSRRTAAWPVPAVLNRSGSDSAGHSSGGL